MAEGTKSRMLCIALLTTALLSSKTASGHLLALAALWYLQQNVIPLEPHAGYPYPPPVYPGGYYPGSGFFPGGYQPPTHFGAFPYAPGGGFGFFPTAFPNTGFDYDESLEDVFDPGDVFLEK